MEWDRRRTDGTPHKRDQVETEYLGQSSNVLQAKPESEVTSRVPHTLPHGGEWLRCRICFVLQGFVALLGALVDPRLRPLPPVPHGTLRFVSRRAPAPAAEASATLTGGLGCRPHGRPTPTTHAGQKTTTHRRNVTEKRGTKMEHYRALSATRQRVGERRTNSGRGHEGVTLAPPRSFGDRPSGRAPSYGASRASPFPLGP
jgi:hypothetical protein